MEKYSVREVVEQAVRTERLGYDFYTSMILRFPEDKGLQELFGKLAEKEREHEKKFLDLEATIRDEEPVDWEEVSEYLRAIVESEFFLGRDKALPELEHVKTVKDAVRFAIGFEKETLLYFYGLRDVVRNVANEKKVIDIIIEEEKSHVIMLSRFGAGSGSL
ncbi:MAG: ferritin family protein [Nitrospiraceae bacterium]|nr:ferritin family protein [Nitrospiraceae bacterium]